MITRRFSLVILAALSLAACESAGVHPDSAASTDWNFHPLALDPGTAPPGPLVRTVTDGQAPRIEYDTREFARWDLPWRPPANMGAEDSGDESAGDAGGEAGGE